MERHNERKNISYGNGDVVPERFFLNVHFKQYDGTYDQEFSRPRKLKTEAKVFDELVFDVNSA